MLAVLGRTGLGIVFLTLSRVIVSADHQDMSARNRGGKLHAVK